MELRIQIDELDYGTLAALILPMLPDNVDSGFLLNSVKNKPALVKNVVNAMPKKKQEELAMSLINNHKDRISRGIMQLAASKGVKARVSGVKALPSAAPAVKKPVGKPAPKAAAKPAARPAAKAAAAKPSAPRKIT